MLKKCLAILIIFLFIGMSIVPSTAVQELKEKPSPISFDGNTLYVGGSGPNNYTTIQSAINNASDGDTVFVYDDSSPYYENLIIDKSINLIGENKLTTHLDGGNNNNTIYLSADGINLSGFTIQNGRKIDSGLIAGIKVISQYNSIYGNIIINNRRGILLYQNNINNFNSIINNQIETNDNEGIFFYDTHNCNIINNTVMLNGDNEISFFGSSNNLVRENTIVATSFSAIWVNGGDNNKLSNNVIQSSDGYGIRLVSSHSTVEGNIIANCSNVGIYISSTNYITIKDNQLINNGFFMRDTSYNVVSNNIVNGKPLVYMEDISDTVFDGNAGQVILNRCNNVTIRNQEINSVDYGIIVMNSHYCNICFNSVFSNNVYGIYMRDDSSFNNISDNSLTDNGIGIHCYSGLDNTFYGNEIWGNSVGISFFMSDGNIVRDNNIFSNNAGISSKKSSNLDIFENTIHSNLGNGIYLEDFSYCTISNNHITENLVGLSLSQFSRWRFKNFILSNNFIDNNRDAEFWDGWPLFFTRSHIWRNNYWDVLVENDRFKLIVGKFIYRYVFNINGDIVGYRTIPWINVDWNPAQEPYDIEAL